MSCLFWRELEKRTQRCFPLFFFHSLRFRCRVRYCLVVGEWTHSPGPRGQESRGEEKQSRGGCWPGWCGVQVQLWIFRRIEKPTSGDGDNVLLQSLKNHKNSCNKVLAWMRRLQLRVRDVSGGSGCKQPSSLLSSVPETFRGSSKKVH